jgi:hypothetical protein
MFALIPNQDIIQKLVNNGSINDKYDVIFFVSYDKQLAIKTMNILNGIDKNIDIIKSLTLSGEEYYPEVINIINIFEIIEININYFLVNYIDPIQPYVFEENIDDSIFFEGILNGPFTLEERIEYNNKYFNHEILNYLRDTIKMNIC